MIEGTDRAISHHTAAAGRPIPSLPESYRKLRIFRIADRIIELIISIYILWMTGSGAWHFYTLMIKESVVRTPADAALLFEIYLICFFTILIGLAMSMSGKNTSTSQLLWMGATAAFIPVVLIEYLYLIAKKDWTAVAIGPLLLAGCGLVQLAYLVNRFWHKDKVVRSGTGMGRYNETTITSLMKELQKDPSFSVQVTDPNLEVCMTETTEIKAYHEAGHYIAAKKLGFSTKEVNIIGNGDAGGQVLLDIPMVLKASQIRKLVMVKYAGFLAEKLLNDEPSDGCMGSDGADVESANALLTKYIILTDDSLSLTGYEDEHIKHIAIELSKTWKQEVEEILIENKAEILEIANKLIADGKYVPKVE